MNPLVYSKLIFDVLRDYERTNKNPEIAAHAFEMVGAQARQLLKLPSSNQDSVEMAAKAMQHYASCGLCEYDLSLKCRQFDNIYTGYLLAFYTLKNSPCKEIDAARAHIDEMEKVIAKTVDEKYALSYIHKQPPLYFMNEPWNYGLWWSYYAKVKTITFGD